MLFPTASQIEDTYRQELNNALLNGPELFEYFLTKPALDLWGHYFTIRKIYVDAFTPEEFDQFGLDFSKLHAFLQEPELLAVLAGQRGSDVQSWIRHTWLEPLVIVLMQKSRWGLVQLILDSVEAAGPPLTVDYPKFPDLLKKFQDRGWLAEDKANLALIFRTKLPFSPGQLSWFDLAIPLDWYKLIGREFLSRPVIEGKTQR